MNKKLLSAVCAAAMMAGATTFALAGAHKSTTEVDDAVFSRGKAFDFTQERKDDLASAMAVYMRTMEEDSYEHQVNDALVKMTLTSLQFAKDNDMMAEYREKDLETVTPMLNRVAKLIEQTGNLEFALDTITETSCFYQLILDGYTREPGKLTFNSPYGRVLNVTQKMGQHDLTEQEIHEQWTKPRYERYGEILGVDITVSEWNDDGVITVTVGSTS